MDEVNDGTIGPAIRYTVAEVRPGDSPFRAYPIKTTPHMEGPLDWSVEFSAVFRKGYLSAGGASLVSNFGKVQEIDGRFQVISGIDSYKGRPEIVVKNPAGDVNWGAYRATRTLKQDVKYDIRVFTRGKTIYLSVNGEVWASGPLHPDWVGFAPVSVHAGAYGFGIPVGAEYVNGPLTIQLVQQCQ